MKGASAAQAPRMTSNAPLVAPRVHGTRILLSWMPRSEKTNFMSCPTAVITAFLVSGVGLPVAGRPTPPGTSVGAGGGVPTDAPLVGRLARMSLGGRL